MSLSEISIRKPVFAWMLMAALIVFGLVSFTRLGISILPDVDFPVISVSVSLPGAAPEIIEGQVLDALEDAIMQIDGIKNITSTASQSSGSISVEFELGRDIDQALQEINDRIGQARNLLPVGLFPPTVRKSNPEDQPILWLALTNTDTKLPISEMMMFSRNYLLNQFTMVPGVGNVVQGGYVDPALRVWVDLSRLDKLNLTSDDVLTAISKEHSEMPAGRMSDVGHEYNLRVLGEARSPNEFGKILIQNRAGQGANFRKTTISDIAQVEEGIADVRKISRLNGIRAMGIGIVKQHGSNAVEVARLVREKVAEIAPNIPSNYHLDVRSDNTRFIKQAVDQLLVVLGLSALLTSIVCYLFLGSWTSTMNVLFAIPTSIVGAFIGFFFLHFTLNTFTLLGLSLAIGIVVDDAIMMLENIVRHRELGQGKKEAAIRGSEEITFAALAATLAVVAIFLPVVFMKGIIGRYFLQYGVTVTIAVLLSLLEALTLTPMRCSRYLVVSHELKGLAKWVDHFFQGLARVYSNVLLVLLKHRWKTVFVTLVLFVGSCFISRLLPSELMPTQDQSALTIRFKLPVGTALAITDAKIKQVEDFLLKQPEVSAVFANVGGYGGDAVNQGNASVTLVDKDKRKLSQAELSAKWRTELRAMMGPDLALKGRTNKSDAPGNSKPAPSADAAHYSGPNTRPVRAETDPNLKGDSKYDAGGAKPDWKNRRGGGGAAPQKVDAHHLGKQRKGMELTIQDNSLRGFAATRGFPVEFVIQGPDWDELTDKTASIMDEMKKLPSLVDVNTDIQDGMPEAHLTPNRPALAAHGVALSELTKILNALVGGAILNKETEYPKNGHRYEIELRLVADQRNELPELDKIKLRNNRGEVVPLSSLVDVKVEPSLMLISRQNRARAITVYGNPAPGHSQQEAMKETEKLARKMLPPGYSLRMIGSSQSFQESMDSLMIALLFGIIVSYMVLASQFNSFVHPVTVLMALPFSVSGAFIGLWAWHQSINMFSLIGFILLMGIVKKNSILLVDFTNQCRDEGLDVHDALIKACPIRLRPILMTSVATVAGALPEAFNIGVGAETRIPMAVAIIGGVIASTILTLFVVPCVYSLMSKLEGRDPLDIRHPVLVHS